MKIDCLRVCETNKAAADMTKEARNKGKEEEAERKPGMGELTRLWWWNVFITT